MTNDTNLDAALQLVAQLPNVEDIHELPRERLPLVLAKLAQLQAAGFDRLTLGELPPVDPPPERDELLDVEQAAELIGRSESWLRRHGSNLPGFTQPHGKGTRAQWSRAALASWHRSST
jgi:hypothetical protein